MIYAYEIVYVDVPNRIWLIRSRYDERHHVFILRSSRYERLVLGACSWVCQLRQRIKSV